MKKILKILLTIIFIVISVFAVNKLIISNFLLDCLFFLVLAFVFFIMHLFAWITPRTFFNLCWKITRFLPDYYDYDTSYKKLELCDIGILITSIILLGISFLFE